MCSLHRRIVSAGRCG
nr:hypothetical protein [Escherichia coli]